MKPCPELTELEVRRLRDTVLGRKSSNANWDACRENWMRPDSVDWLLAHSKIELKYEPN
jgi:hypothetical protein